MRSRACSRAGSRKSLRSIILVLLLAAAPAVAQLRHDVTVTRVGDHLAVTVVGAGVDGEELRANLERGFTARIEFAIRLLRPRSAPFGFLGYELVHEFRPHYEIRYDPFLRRSVIAAEDGALYSFTDDSDLMRFLLVLPSYRIPWSVFGESVDPRTAPIAVEARVVYDPIVFVPALGLLSLFRFNERHMTPWTRVEPRIGGGE